jgi:aryl-alcohol dehydrogenase-like predicted oxidoreductase
MEIYQNRYLRETVFDLAEELDRVAVQLGRSMAQVALAWILAQPYGVCPIVGALKSSHIRESVEAIAVDLPPELVSSLNRLSAKFRKPTEELIPVYGSLIGASQGS